MKNIRKRCNLIVNLSKFNSNKKILSKVIESKATTNFVAKLCPYNISLFLPSLPLGKFKYDKLVGYNSISID